MFDSKKSRTVIASVFGFAIFNGFFLRVGAPPLLLLEIWAGLVAFAFVMYFVLEWIDKGR